MIRSIWRAVTSGIRRRESAASAAEWNAAHRAEVKAAFDRLYAMLRAVPREERFRAEWVMSEDELRRLDRLMEMTLRSGRPLWFGPGTNLTIFGRPIRLDDSAEGIELVLRPLVAAS